MIIKELNHIALHTADLAASCRFYADILCLKTIPRPAFDFAGEWFRLGKQELHLIAGRTDKETIPNHRRRHFALQVESAEATIAYLEAKKVPFEPPKLRPDGAIQIFLQDPDGHWIELCQLPS
jgi:catechol 2,3-dioxygenase-like lactoylglutathione lyase family enzyme